MSKPAALEAERERTCQRWVERKFVCLYVILHVYAEPRVIILFKDSGWLSPPAQGGNMFTLEGEHWMGNRTLPQF